MNPIFEVSDKLIKIALDIFQWNYLNLVQSNIIILLASPLFS